ncbi:hypothetical protein CGCFRS4_v015912 [Colletotrichum fructicola]|nr:hypothetical protein CGCFRS4_v015912 [Colletotrichum fructicola]
MGVQAVYGERRDRRATEARQESRHKIATAVSNVHA